MAQPWDIKLDRASEHLRELQRVVDELQATGDFAVTTDRRGVVRVVRLAQVSEPPDRLSAIVGDVVHNLRSSIDSVLLGAILVGTTLTDEEERVAMFPITSNETNFNEQAKRRLRHAPPELVDVVRRLQPWYWLMRSSNPPSDDAAVGTAVRSDQLILLDELANIDKHRRVHLTKWYAEHIGLGVPDGINAEWRYATPDERTTGVVGHWVVTGEGAEDVELNAYGEASLTLDYYVERGWHHVELLSQLRGHASYTDYVVGMVAKTVGLR